MSEIVSFYDWYLSQRTKPKSIIAKSIEKASNLLKEPKDIEEEE